MAAILRLLQSKNSQLKQQRLSEIYQSYIEQALKPISLEVKAKNIAKPQISRSFRSFLRTYQPERAYYLNLGYDGVPEFEEVTVSFLTPENFAKLREF